MSELFGNGQFLEGLISNPSRVQSQIHLDSNISNTILNPLPNPISNPSQIIPKSNLTATKKAVAAAKRKTYKPKSLSIRGDKQEFEAFKELLKKWNRLNKAKAQKREVTRTRVTLPRTLSTLPRATKLTKKQISDLILKKAKKTVHARPSKRT